jgi:predicted RNase H-like HicB family nuclease
MMRYPIAIEPGPEVTAFGVVVPDLPGCFSAGDTLDEAVGGAEEAAAAWIDAALDEGRAIPKPSGLDAVCRMPDYAGWTLGVVTIDPALRRLDALAKAEGESRSGYIARMTLEARRVAV